MVQFSRFVNEIRTPEEGGISVDQNNLNPVLQAVTWLLLALSSLTIAFRLVTKLYIKSRQPLELGDVFIISAYVLLVGESVTLLVPDSTVYGRNISELSQAQLVAGLKTGYARDLLLLLSIGLSKLSVCESLRALSPDRRHRSWAYAICCAIVLWSTVSIFGTAFQCGTDGPWRLGSAECINIVAFDILVIIASILIDVSLLVLPTVIVYPLQMSLKLRLMILAFFWSRLIVIAASIIQVIYASRLSNENFTLDAFPYYLSGQIVMFTSIAAACLVYFWPFLHSLQSGTMSANPSTLTSHYPLSKLSNMNLRKARSMTLNTFPSQNDRNQYIEITTDTSVVHSSRREQSGGSV
ncbi:hypothetical protein F4778DRAFT_624657 [Xylariomycetidae sp. FL2044]|nr:hypothetical protein F4778DRAFT_624657 [Xylariomycetidae sp. FL2044]